MFRNKEIRRIAILYLIIVSVTTADRLSDRHYGRRAGASFSLFTGNYILYVYRGALSEDSKVVRAD